MPVEVQATLNDGSINTLTVLAMPSTEKVAKFVVSDGGVAKVSRIYDNHPGRLFEACVKVGQSEYVDEVDLLAYGDIRLTIDSAELDRWEKQIEETEV